MAKREPWIELQHLLIGADRLLESALVLENQAQVVMRRGAIRIERDRLLADGNRFSGTPCLSQSSGQVVERVGIRRAQTQSTAVRLNGLVELPLIVQYATEAEV